jgi:creatinine amidohydrolase
MHLQDLNWMDVERYLQTDDRIILITGATEQHAYLSLLTDILIPSRIALAVVQREPVLIAPSLNFGTSEEFIDFPGTISISRAVFDMVLTEIVESLLQQGFRRFFVLNGHGGNKQPARLTELQLEGEMRIDWYDWWTSEVVRQFEADHALDLDHANWGENFPFNRVAESPTEVKPPVNVELFESGQPAREVFGDGSFGGYYQVDDSVILALFDQIVADVTERVRRL